MMTLSAVDARLRAVDQAIANNGLSGFQPSEFGRNVFEQWIGGHWTTDEAVALVIQHYRDNPIQDSDNAARENRMGLTDSQQLRLAEADITALRMADLDVDPA
ncbi:hypothetical protein EZJ19_08540 [Parasulfuritortus cantonensis]|uniref:Antitoxin VbhA domain-containing protein n=1 Tax=Parasulfuritortus cantonensis TaxID=2528202 RepID=A0A4R1BD24_9PROT|nr:antitoxin VbhA family protein [Parasulfuritortus cantonensis]TCJ14924.1 hypothetical protein EZJ19_08540 [Parasulfuritortus cantonensis]